MGKYCSIAVIYGSDTSESEVSCRSGEFVSSRMDGTRYDVYEIFARFGKWCLVACRKRNSMRVTFPEGARPEVDKNDFSVTVLGKKVKFDYAYIMQHGAPGENGLMQGYLEMIGVPFNTCSAYVSTVAFDKYACKNCLRGIGCVKFAPDAFVREGMDVDKFASDTASRLRFPVFVKPTQGGSSFGVSKVDKPSDLSAAVKFAFSEGPSVLVEQGISGRELTVAAYRREGKVETLPPIEIVTDNEYFDYDAKYNGHSREVCPAEISAEDSARLSEATKAVYSWLGCRGVVRMDYILADDGLYFLEVNTIPGMTSASLVPKMVAAAGIDMTDFLTGIIEES